MKIKAEQPFETLAVRYAVEDINTSIFSTTDTPGEWIDPYDHTITGHEFVVYGVPNTEDTLDKVYEGDFSVAAQIGRICFHHVPS